MANGNESMSASELKYLLAIEELCREEGKSTNLTAISEKMYLTKASVSHALERLEERGYLLRVGKLISVSERGKEALAEYYLLIEFISKHLEAHCNVSPQTACHC